MTAYYAIILAACITVGASSVASPPPCSSSHFVADVATVSGALQAIFVSQSTTCRVPANTTFSLDIPLLFSNSGNSTTAILGAMHVGSGITLDSPSSSIVILGWNTSTAHQHQISYFEDLATKSQRNFTVLISNISGAGRFIIAGSFPAVGSRNVGTSIWIRDLSLEYSQYGSNLQSTPEAPALGADYSHDCIIGNGSAAAFCVGQLNLSMWMKVGPNVSVSSTHTQDSSVTTTDAYGLTLAAIAWFFSDSPSCGTLEVNGVDAFVVSIHTSASIASLNQGIPGTVAGAVITLNSGRIDSRSFSIVNSTFEAYVNDFPSLAHEVDMSIVATMGLQLKSSTTTLVVGYEAKLELKHNEFHARRISGGSTDDDTVRHLPAQVAALVVNSLNSSSGMNEAFFLYRSSVFVMENCIFFVWANESSVGVHFGSVSVSHSAVARIHLNSWNVTSVMGNSSSISLALYSLFPSLFAIYNNTALVKTIANDFLVCWIDLRAGSLRSQSQFLLYGNNIVLEANTTYIFPPTGVNLTESTADDGPVAIIPIQPVGVHFGRNSRFYIGAGASFVTQFNIINFTEAAMPLFMDGDSADYIIDLDVGSALKIVSLTIYANGNSAVVLRRQSMRIRFVGGQYSASLVVGCVVLNNIVPEYVLSDIMAATLVTYITAISDCDCATPEAAIGEADQVTGQYPRCNYTCRRPSSCPISEFRLQCAQPTFFSSSASLTTKTPRLQATATTYTAGLTPSWNRTLSRNTKTKSMLITVSALSTISKTAALSTTRELTQTHTIASTRTHSRSGRNSTRTHSTNVSSTKSLLRSIGATLSLSRVRFSPSEDLTRSRVITRSRSASLPPSETAISPRRTYTLGVSVSARESASRTTSETMTALETSHSSTGVLTLTIPRTRHTNPASTSQSSSASISASKLQLSLTFTHSRKYSRTPPPPGPVYQFLSQSRALGFLTLSLTTLTSVISGNPSVFHTQFLAILGQIYASSDNAYQRTLPMAYIVSPFWDFGPIKVAVANVVIIVAFAVLHTVALRLDLASLVGIKSNASDSPWTSVDVGESRTENSELSNIAKQAKEKERKLVVAKLPLPHIWASHLFPQATLVVAMVFYQGLVSAAFNIFYHESGAAFMLGTLSLVLSALFASAYYWIMYSLLEFRKPGFCAVERTGGILAKLLPWGRWMDEPPPGHGRSLICFGAVFKGLHPESIRFGGYPYLVVFFVNAAASAHANSSQERNAQFGMLGCVFLIAALFLVVFRPHRTFLSNVVYTLSFVLLTILCVCLANESDRVEAADGVPVIIVIVEILMWCHGILEIAIYVAEFNQSAAPRRAKDEVPRNLEIKAEAPTIAMIHEDENVDPYLLSQNSRISVLMEDIPKPRLGSFPPPPPSPPSPTPPPSPPQEEVHSEFLPPVQPSTQPQSTMDDTFFAAFATPDEPQKPPQALQSLLARSAPQLKTAVVRTAPMVAKKKSKVTKRRSSSSSSSELFSSSSDSDDSDL